MKSFCLRVIFLISIFLFYCTLLKGQPNLHWGTRFGGSLNDYGTSIAVDAQGNTYVTGFFRGTVTVDGQTITSVGETDIFLAKYDPNGTLIWIKSFGSPQADESKSLAIDNFGNVFLGGAIGGSVSFGGSATFNSKGGPDLFVASFDPNGNYRWAMATGNTGNDVVNNIAIDKNNDVYLTGTFTRQVAFDPSSPGVLTGADNSADVFIAKYSNTGDFRWVRNMGQNGSQNLGTFITVDANLNVYVTGEMQGTVDFDPSANTANLISKGGVDAFAAKYDQNGNYLWAFSLGAANFDRGVGIHAATDGTIFLTGIFTGTVDFNPQIATINQMTSTGEYDAFIAKYDQNGNYISANKVGGSGSKMLLTSSAIDRNNNIYLTGGFTSTVDFDPGAGVQNGVSMNAGFDVFLAKYTSAGNYDWHLTLNGTGLYDQGTSVGVDQNGNSYLIGSFDSELDIDPTACEIKVTSQQSDAFFVRYTDDITFLTDILKFSIPGQIAPAVINRTNATITVEMPPGTNLSSLTPQITVSPCSSINPSSAVATDFTNPVIYTVTDKYNNTKQWTVSIKSGVSCSGTVDIETNRPNSQASAIWLCETESSNLSFKSTVVLGFPDPVYQWQISKDNLTWNDLANANTASLSFTNLELSNTGFYRLKITSAGTASNCEIFSDVIKLNISFDLIRFQVEGNPSLCENDTVILRRDPSLIGKSFQWLLDGKVIPGATADTLHVLTSGNYYLKVINDDCEFLSGPESVKLNAAPQVAISSAYHCNSSFSFNSNSSSADSSSLSYSWNFGDPASGSANESTLKDPVHVFSGSGIYNVSLTVTTSSGCSKTWVQPIVNDSGETPMAVIQQSKQSYCRGEEIVFVDASDDPPGSNAAHKMEILDLNGQVLATVESLDRVQIKFNAPDSSIQQSFVVRLTVGFSPLCNNSTEMAFTVNPAPSVDFDFVDNCDGSFNFISNSSSADSSTLSFSWNFGDAASGANESTVQNPVHVFSSAGTFRVALTVAVSGGCSKTFEREITVTGADPVAAIQQLNQANCSGAELVFQDNSTTRLGAISRRLWEIRDANGQVLVTGSDPQIRFSAPDSSLQQSFVVRLIAGFSDSCTSSTELSFTVNPNPQVSIRIAYPPVCISDADFPLTGGLPENGNGGTGTYWVNGVQSPTFSPQTLGVGTHTIRYSFIASGSNCESFAEQTIAVVGIPEVECRDFTALLNIPLELKLNTGSTSGLTFLWSPSTGLSDPTIANPVLTPSVNTAYRVTIGNEAGCTKECVVNITVVPNIQVPNVFTPNGDGANDLWVIPGIESYPGIEVFVYDRFGSQVFYTNGYAKSWDGTHNNKSLPNGTYYYVINAHLKDVSNLAGAVTIIY